MSELILNASRANTAPAGTLGRKIASFVLQVAFFVAVFAALLANAKPANAQASQHYTAQEIVDAGHNFFGKTSGALASAIERAFAERGMPNGYILGEEAGGAFIGGLRYGEGILYTKNAGDHKVFWQGPSLGIDYGANGTRTMMLVYNLPEVNALYKRYAGVSSSAYVIAGLGFHVLKNRDVLLVPIETGVGARLGVNLGYLKLTRRATWNPL